MNLPPTKKRSTPIPEPQVSTPKIKTFDPAGIQSEIHKLLKLSTFEPEQRYWLDTGSSELNAVLGSKTLGLAYGKIYELSGLEHGGKTTLSTILAGIAQRDGATIGYVDLEDSRDERWAEKLGLSWPSVIQIYPKLIYENKKQDIPRLQYAEELFKEAEIGMQVLAKQGVKKQFWIVDSVANIQSQKMVDAGFDQTMNTRLDRAVFLKFLLPRWAGIGANYNASIFLVNQLSPRIGMVFGDPYETSGGRAIKTNCSIRARVRRLKNGRLLKNGKTVGLVGIIKNYKNKAGGGSYQDAECGFRILWNYTPAKVDFMSTDEAEKILKGE